MNESNTEFLATVSEDNLTRPERLSVNKYPPSVVFSKPSHLRKVKENQISFDSKKKLREALLQVIYISIYIINIHIIIIILTISK